MKKLLLLMSLAMLCLAAGNPKVSWSPAALLKADTGKTALYLTSEERKVIQLMNLARTDGKLFFDTYVQEYVIQVNRDFTMVDVNGHYYKSLQRDLYRVKKLPLLESDRHLFEAARYHAKDMGLIGGVGHESSDGTRFGPRVRKYIGEDWTAVAENCFYGKGKALSIVVELLIDEDVPSLGHRLNILNPDFTKVGVAIAPHQEYESNCVMDFSAGKQL